MSDGNIFSDSDVNILRAMVRDFKSRVQNTRNRPAIELPEGQSPDVYVAHAHSGIPSMTFGAGTGTGTGALAVDSPGSSKCNVYRRSEISGLLSTGLTLTVYNYSTSAVASGSWVVVNRDKFGDWVVQASAPSSTTPFSGAFATANVGDIAGTADPTPVSPGIVDYVLFVGDASWDTDGYWNGSESLTVPTNGIYELLGYADLYEIPPVGTSGTFRTISLDQFQAGTNIYGHSMRFTPIQYDGHTIMETAFQFYATAGDQFRLGVSHDADAALSLIFATLQIKRLSQVTL